MSFPPSFPAFVNTRMGEGGFAYILSKRKLAILYKTSTHKFVGFS